MTDHITPGSDGELLPFQTRLELTELIDLMMGADTVNRTFYVNRIGEIMQPFIRRTKLESRISELEKFIKYSNGYSGDAAYSKEPFYVVTLNDIESRIAGLEAERRKLGGGGEGITYGGGSRG